MRFIAGFIIGLIIGSAAVLLTTPRSGSDIKADAKAWMDGVFDEGRKAFEQRRAELENRVVDMQSGRV